MKKRLSIEISKEDIGASLSQAILGEQKVNTKIECSNLKFSKKQLRALNNHLQAIEEIVTDAIEQPTTKGSFLFLHKNAIQKETLLERTHHEECRANKIASFFQELRHSDSYFEDSFGRPLSVKTQKVQK